MNAPSRRPGFPARLGTGSAPRSHHFAPRRAVPAPAPQTPVVRDAIAARARMIERLMAGGITDEALLRALGAVDRRHFVDSALALRAYDDDALPIGMGQTISKPSIVARMVQLLVQGGVRAPDGGRLGRVLEIGTGCGYQAVLLGQLAAEVYSIERLRALHEKARANLRPLRVPNVHLIFGDGMAGYPAGAPYAGIIAAAGGEAVPLAWVEQLAMGGRIVAPVAQAGGAQALVVIDKTMHGIEHRVLEAVHFVPLKSGVS